ncbi:protein-glutamate O-methyltransferase CheR [Caldicellulosiruptoraceae bacterium PP1]
MIYDYEWFKKKILDFIGINLNYYKEKQMKRRIESLIKKNGYEGFYDYYNAITKDTKLYTEFINYLTINVSEFYRNPNQWEILEKEVIPYLLKKNPKPKIWSAACSTGEEPYSLAMLLSKFFPLKDIKIFATDIDNDAISKAKQGIYVKKSLESLPPEFIKRYFKAIGELYYISDEIKNCVNFSHHDLLKDEYPKNFDLIVCRNVLIYFTEEAKDMIYRKFNQSLRMNGILFVGSTEQIIASQKYGFKANKTFFYEKVMEV